MMCRGLFSEICGEAGVRMISLEWHEELTSTAEVLCARARTEDVPDGTLLLAGRQTAGRGRGSAEEKPFYSPAGGCYMSLLLRGVCFDDSLSLTSRTALAARRVLARYGCGVGVKWVNDLFCGGKKVGGILAQRPAGGAAEDCTVVSCGINLYPEPAEPPPDELRDIMGWCFRDASEAPEIRAFALALAEEIAGIASEQDNGALVREYREASIVLGKNIKHEYNGLSVHAMALDITSAGGLLVRHADGRETALTSGSITLLS